MRGLRGMTGLRLTPRIDSRVRGCFLLAMATRSFSALRLMKWLWCMRGLRFRWFRSQVLLGRFGSCTRFR